MYEIGKLIGTGSSGDVFLCRHKDEQDYNYAMKKIRMMDIEDKVRENIENELKLLQKLRHTNIVSFKDSFTDKDGNLCIVMVYCEMGDMHLKIKQTKERGKSFTEAQILDWFMQTALAIYYLHQQKILHRDLKSQNLFLRRDDRIKLGDFGISKVLDATQDLTRTCVGTPYYMAPEVFNYQPYSYKSDIWSLGVIIYEMCNLRLPFEAQFYNGLACKVLKGSFPSITPTYSKQLRDLIKMMLSRKPHDRPTIVEILNKPFIRTRMEKYMADLFSRAGQGKNQQLYLDTLREQAVLLNIQDQDILRRYPSNKDLEKKLGRSIGRRRGEDEDSDLIQHHSKRRSTVERDSHSYDRSQNRENNTSTTTSSVRGLDLGFDLKDEKEAFIDKNRMKIMEREQRRLQPRSQFHPQVKKVNLHEEYSMDEESLIVPNESIQEEIIHEEQDEDLQSTMNLTELQEDEEVPESYNKSYYKLLDQVKVLQHRCETAIGGNKYLRAYNAVNKGATKADILEILGDKLIGYWHLIDQIMFNESILKTLPKN